MAVNSSCECRGENRRSSVARSRRGYLGTCSSQPASRVQEPGDQVVTCNPYIEVKALCRSLLPHTLTTFCSTISRNTPKQTWLENNYATMARRSSSQVPVEDSEGHMRSSSPHEEPMSWSTTWVAPSRARAVAARYMSLPQSVSQIMLTLFFP